MTERYNPRRRATRLTGTRVGLLALVVVSVATFLIFKKELPFRSHYEIKAVVRTAANIKANAAVRTAGVDVGKVVRVHHPQPGKPVAMLTIRIEDAGRPIHKDATLKIRPRLFLEGNFFVDLRPGTPGSPELADGGVLPIQQTSSPVALSQILTALQSDTRRNLQTLLREYSSALQGAGARGFRRSLPYWAPAYRSSAIVQEATLGLEPHDLSEYVDHAGRIARGLDRSPAQLRNLISDLDTAAGAFAARAAELEAAIAELPHTLRAARPALARLDQALPSLRRLTADLEPGIRASGPALRVGMPFVRESRRLASRAELGGLVPELERVVPSLTRLSHRTVPLYEQVRLASSCENEVVLPWASDRLVDPNFPATGPVSEEAVKSLPGLAGESRTADANGQYFRVLASAGDHTLSMGDGRFAQAYLPLQGTNPPKQPMSPLRPDVPCETQERPDLRTRVGGAEGVVARGRPRTAAADRRYARAKAAAIRWMRRTIRREGLSRELRVVERHATRAELFGGDGK